MDTRPVAAFSQPATIAPSIHRVGAARNAAADSQPPWPPSGLEFDLGGLDRRHLAAIIEGAEDAIVARTLDGRILCWNPGAERLYGYNAEEIIDRPIECLVPPDRRGELPSIEERLLRGEHVPPFETVRLRKDGRVVDVSITISPIRDAQARVVGASAIARDISERKRAEAELQHARVDLERRVSERTAELAAANALLEAGAQRLCELATLKADFTAMVAHELDSSIAAVRNLAEMLMRWELRPEEQSHALGTIRAETEALQALVADVRAAALAERDDFAVRPQPVPVVELLADAVGSNRSLPGQHPLLTLIATPDRVLADRERIGQVLRNLIGNAAKYSPPGAPIELRAVRRGDRVRIEVADRGPGIPANELRRVFEKFGRGRDAEGGRVPGVGLGLYLSRRILRAHGGELAAESTPGVGSVFAFELDVAP